MLSQEIIFRTKLKGDPIDLREYDMDKDWNGLIPVLEENGVIRRCNHETSNRQVTYEVLYPMLATYKEPARHAGHRRRIEFIIEEGNTVAAQVHLQ